VSGSIPSKIGRKSKKNRYFLEKFWKMRRNSTTKYIFIDDKKINLVYVRKFPAVLFLRCAAASYSVVSMARG